MEKFLKILKKQPSRSNYYPEENEKKEHFEIPRHMEKLRSVKESWNTTGISHNGHKKVKLFLYDSIEMQIQFMGIPAKNHGRYGAK